VSRNRKGSARSTALEVVREQLAEAAAAGKCHGCGCLHRTVEALEGTEAGRGELAPALAEARRVFIPKKYDCLGCEVCFPAIAANAFGEAFAGEAAGLDLCPTDAPEERRGWPPLPGDYRVIRYQAPVAVCTLNSDETAAALAERRPDGLAIVGTLHTENLGIERLIRNTLANPHVRRLILCGEDTRQAIGHLPGQSLESLAANGVDESGRIRGARGKRPVLKNVTADQVEAFRRQVRIVSLVGETDVERLSVNVQREAGASPGAFEGAPVDAGIVTTAASEPRKLVPDPAGYCVVYPDRVRQRLQVEHYTNAGVLDGVVEGVTPGAVSATAIERGFVSRLDHAAYLGRELARAERSLLTGEPYVQDRAPGELESREASCGCSTACGTEKA
jgi:tetrahydromethanopterin S-methyltransferase subunit A